MRGQSHSGKGGYLQPWHRQRAVDYQVPIPQRNYHNSYSGDNALNVIMSTDHPPYWGPHKQGELPYFQFVQLVKEWVRACKVDEEKQADIVYHHLQGVAKSTISNWLDDPAKTDRRTMRMKKGNMKHRNKKYKERLKEMEEKEKMREEAILNTVRDFYGPDILPRGLIVNKPPSVPRAPGEEEIGDELEYLQAQDASEEAEVAGEAVASAAASVGEGTPARAGQPRFRTPGAEASSPHAEDDQESAKGPGKGKGVPQSRHYIHVQVPANPYETEVDSDESEGEAKEPRSGVEIILYMLQGFGGDDDVRTMVLLQISSNSADFTMNLLKKLLLVGTSSWRSSLDVESRWKNHFILLTVGLNNFTFLFQSCHRFFLK